MTDITTNEFSVDINGHAVTGVEWLVDAPFIYAGDTSPDKATFEGRNAGKTRTSYVLRGIPYAHQPIGSRRFKPAEMLPPSAPLDAREYGGVSLQESSTARVSYQYGRSDLGTDRGSYAWTRLGTGKSEACLYLNVFTPDISNTANLPIEVHFHPGGSKELSSVDDMAAGHRAATKGIVIVRVEYRLGALGHFYLPDMDLEADYAGVNFSITDAVAALEFVRAYGASFGGDVSNITISGASAGGNMCLCLAAHPTYSLLFEKMILDGPSAGTDIRWATTGERGSQRGFKKYFAASHEAISEWSDRFVDSQDPSRKLSAAITEHGFNTAIREHMFIDDLMCVGGGGWGPTWEKPTVEAFNAPKSLTIMRDDVSVFHDNNRDAAIAGALAAKPTLIVTAENESSVTGGGTLEYVSIYTLKALCAWTTYDFARSPVFSTEYDGTAASPAWAPSLDFSEPKYPWGTVETMPVSMAFNFTYHHTCLHIAKAIEAAGADAYLVFNNFIADTVNHTDRAGHTTAMPYMFNNPTWCVLAKSPEEDVSVDLVRMCDDWAQKVANFCKYGNPNTDYVYAGDFDLFATGLGQPLTAFNPTDYNWNVWGNVGGFADGAPLTFTNVNNFWKHAYDEFDAGMVNL